MSETFDVLVLGGGLAGLAAANRAAQLGLSAAIVEQGDGEHYPCNSRFSGGVMHLAFHNVKDAPERLVQAIEAATYGAADLRLAQAIAEDSGRAVDWLRDEGARFIRVGQVVWQQWVLAPPRPLTAGLDWRGRGPDVTLRALMARFRQRGGRVFFNATGTALVERNGDCVGLQATIAGAQSTLDARAVVIADGGFSADLPLLRQGFAPRPERLLQRGAGNARGAGLRMAQAIGAEITDLSTFYGHLLSREALANERLWPYPQLDELATTGIVVDARGARFADEGLGGVYVANMIARRPDPQDCWAVFDAHIWESAGRGARIPANPNLLRAGGTLPRADDLAALARIIGAPAEVIAATIRDYNDAVRSGRCGELSPQRSTSKQAPMTIEKPPFHALPICVGITHTTGGIGVDVHARVRRKGDAVIPGLYAVGAAAGGLEGGAKCGYVGGLMKGLVFGLRAAEHVASRLR